MNISHSNKNLLEKSQRFWFNNYDGIYPLDFRYCKSQKLYLKTEKFIKLFWIIFIIPLFIANQINAQDIYKGSWAISSINENELSNDYYVFKNYKVDFGADGILQYNIVQQGEAEQHEPVAPAGAGAFTLEGDFDFAAFGLQYFFNSQIGQWADNERDELKTDFQIIQHPDEDLDYMIIYSSIYGGGSANEHTPLFYVND